MELLEDWDNFLPGIVPEDEHERFFGEIITYKDQHRGFAFSSPTCWKRESLVKPLYWCKSFGYALCSVKKVALRILAQDCSLGACERN